MIQTKELHKMKADLQSAITQINSELESGPIDTQLDANRLYNILSRNTELTHSEITEIVKTEMEIM
jgi:hypothetical protein